MQDRHLKILIISSFFPPEIAIASQRPYSWAKYWSRAGHDVTVLTVPKGIEQHESWQSNDGFHVIEVPIPCMSFFRSFLGRKNRFIAAPLHDNRAIKPLRSGYLKSLLGRALTRCQNRYGVFASCRMPDRLDFWGRAAFKMVCNQHWDLVVSTAGPYAVHRPAYRLKKAGIASYWISDWRDLWTDNHIYPGLAGFRMVERLLEKRWSRTADSITTVSEPLASKLREKYGNKVHVIYNGFDPEDYEALPKENLLPDDGVFRIVYTGTIYSGYRDPSPLFRAVRNLLQKNLVSPDKLKIIFCGAESSVLELARKHSTERFVEHTGMMPRQQALQMQRNADALLFLEYESETVRGILTGKLFEYLFAGPPIIGVGAGLVANSAAGLLLQQTGSGTCFGTDAELIAEELKTLLSAKHAGTIPAKKINHDKIEEFSRKRQSEIMLSIVHSQSLFRPLSTIRSA